MDASLTLKHRSRSLVSPTDLFGTIPQVDLDKNSLDSKDKSIMQI